MDYAKSGDPEIGVVIKRREWVEGTEIRYRILDIGVGTGSNSPRYLTIIYNCDPHYDSRKLDYYLYDTFPSISAELPI